MHVINIKSGHGKHFIKVGYPLLGGFLSLKSISMQNLLGLPLDRHLYLLARVLASLALGGEDNITEEVEKVSHFEHKAR